MIFKEMNANNLPLSIAYDSVPMIGAWISLTPVLIYAPPRPLSGIEKVN